MKRYIFILVVLMLILITACTPSAGDTVSGEQATVTVSKEQASSQPEESEPATTPTEADVPEPSKIAADQNIPEIAIDAAEKSNSNYMLYEDEKNIYYLWEEEIYCIDRSNGVAKRIINAALRFSAYEGKIFFIEEHTIEHDDFICEIKEYDIETGTTKTIIKTKYPIYQITCHEGKIYYARESEVILDSGETYDNLYEADLKGKNVKKIQEDAHSFCFYNERLFYTSVGGAEGGGLFEYDFNRVQNDLDIAPYIDWHFDISSGIIVFTEESSFKYDIKTGETEALPFNRYNLALVGQYAVYCEYDESLIQISLKAYDFLEAKEYTLLDFSNLIDQYSSVEIHTTKDSIYLCIENRKEKELDMYRVSIEGGKANLEHVASLKND